MFRSALAFCLGLAVLVSPAAADNPEIVEKLTSPDRVNRFEGISAVRDLKTIPADVAEALVESLRLEFQYIHEPPKKQPEPPDLLPSTGNEVPLIRVKASPGDYIDERFPVIGHAKISDYYNWGYRTAQATHYSIQLVDAHGGRTIAHLYLKRGIGDALAEQLTRNVERGIPATPIRAIVSLASERRPTADTWDMLEMHDVQFLEDGKAWGLPLLAGGVNIVAQLRRCQKDAAPGLAAAMVAAGDTATDKALRNEALLVVCKMDKAGRTAAIAALRRIERDTEGKDERAKIRDLMDTIEKQGRLTDIKAAKSKAKKR